jgi:hypothetical protein
MADEVNRREGWNWQGFMPPQVSTLLWQHWISPNDRSSPMPADDPLPGILVWTTPHSRTWLILDQREGNRDKVYNIAGDEDTLRGDGDDFDDAYPDWVQWLRGLWRSIESAAECSPTKVPGLIHKPRTSIRIPATPWRMRDQAPWTMAPSITRVPVPSNPTDRELRFWYLRCQALSLKLPARFSHSTV